MLLKFKHIRSREAINNQMMRKFNDILAQYMKEVRISYCLFKKKLVLVCGNVGDIEFKSQAVQISCRLQMVRHRFNICAAEVAVLL